MSHSKMMKSHIVKETIENLKNIKRCLKTNDMSQVIVMHIDKIISLSKSYEDHQFSGYHNTYRHEVEKLRKSFEKTLKSLYPNLTYHDACRLLVDFLDNIHTHQDLREIYESRDELEKFVDLFSSNLC